MASDGRAKLGQSWVWSQSLEPLVCFVADHLGFHANQGSEEPLPEKPGWVHEPWRQGLELERGAGGHLPRGCDSSLTFSPRSSPHTRISAFS